jgi:type II secretory pathway component PulF
MNLNFDPEALYARLMISSSRTRADFYEDFAAALDDGVDVVTYLRKRRDRAREMRDPLRPLYARWLRKMDTQSLSRALRGSGIPESEIMVVSAGESGAALPENLRFLAKTVREIAQMKRLVLSATIAPAIIFAVMAGLLYGFAYHFLPVLAQVFPVAKWPASGQRLYAVAQFVTSYGLFVVLGVVALVALVSWSFTGWIFNGRRRLDDFLPYSLFRAYSGSITLVSLASLLNAGNSLVQSLESVGRLSNRWVKWHMRTIVRRLDALSANPGKAFDTGLLPRRALNRVVDRAERSNFGEAIQSIGFSVIADIRKEIEAGAKSLNMVMLLLAGICLGGMMFGFLDTVYSIRSAVQVR